MFHRRAASAWQRTENRAPQGLEKYEYHQGKKKSAGQSRSRRGSTNARMKKSRAGCPEGRLKELGVGGGGGGSKQKEKIAPSAIQAMRSTVMRIGWGELK